MELNLRRNKRGVDFKPPKDNHLVLTLAYSMLPLIMRTMLKIKTVQVEEDDLVRLRQLEGQRVVLTPNHPTHWDPVVMFQFSKLFGEEFNYLAARELFDRASLAWLLQRCGVYSVMRGTNDRESFRTTVDLLTRGKRKLVMFPEGLTCWQNDTVMPFHGGVALFGFWALEELAKKGPPPPLYLVPVSIKYIYVRNMQKEITHSLTMLQRSLGLSLGHLSLYEQLRKVGEAVLASAESEYGVRPKPDANLNTRIQNIKELLVNRIATGIGVNLKPDQPLADRIRTLINTVDQIVHEEPQGPDYKIDLHHQRQEQVKPFYDDLSRVLRFIATYDGYVRETLSVERFLDTIGQLEREVLGKRRKQGPRKALIRIGEPVNLADYFDRFKKEKRNTIEFATTQLESRVKKMLNEMGRFTVPLEKLSP
ncbi:1-acyl-sn-glycerol-3-phosphate acyltransferase [candidate division TA06 bacterium]|nr:1-acyl-sn-glycerol-3-phosphate acyltransferase [candidate division TA06 bacterium]